MKIKWKWLLLGGLQTHAPGLSSLGVPGVPWHTQILADLLTLFQPGGTDYAHLITIYWHNRIFRPSDGPEV